MKIGQIVAIHAVLEKLTNEKGATYSPRFLFWLKSTIQKTAPIQKNLQESVQGLKTPRVVEFEEKRGILIESLVSQDMNEDEKEAQYQESIKPIVAEYAEDIKAYEDAVKDFEQEILEDISDVTLSVVKFSDLPKLTSDLTQTLLPIIDLKSYPKKESSIPFVNILSLANVNTSNFSNELNLAIVSFLESVREQYIEFVELRQKYNTHEQFGQYSIEKTQATQSTKDKDELVIVLDEINNRFSEVYQLEQKLEEIMKLEITCDLLHTSVDCLPTEMTADNFNAIEFLISE